MRDYLIVIIRILGIVLFAYGLFLIWRPLAFIVVGIMFISADQDNPTNESEEVER